MKVYLKGGWTRCSKKDLKACAMELKKILNNKPFEDCITHFKKLKENQGYISYKENLKGLSHHQNKGCARRPLKSYGYVIDFLKGLRGSLKHLEDKKVKIIFNEVIINNSGTYKPRGTKEKRTTLQMYRFLIRLTYE